MANFNLLENYSNEFSWKFKAVRGILTIRNNNQALIISGVMFDDLTERIPSWMKQIAVGSILGILIYSFKLFHPLAYGFADASTERNSTMFG